MSPDWNERFSQADFVYGTEPNDFLRQMATELPKGRVLLLAEGEGRNAVYLASLGYDVLGVDQSEVGLAKAQRLASERGVTIGTQQADLAEFDIAPSSFAGIVSISCHLPVAIREPLHRKVVNGLQSGGVFILEAYIPQQCGRGTGGPPTVELLASLETLRQELDGLQFVHAMELERDVIEGQFHTGSAAVVQLVGRKA